MVFDELVQTRLATSMAGWLQVKEQGANLLMWWQLIVERGVKHLAQVRGREIKKQRMGQLSLLKLRQAYLTNKISNDDKGILTELKVISLKFHEWYEEES